MLAYNYMYILVIRVKSLGVMVISSTYKTVLTP